MDTRYSEEQLSSFLDYTVQKGLLNESTGKSRKIAAQRILAVLDDQEKQDLRAIDVEAVFQRFANKNGREFTPDSLSSYKSRFKSALDDFFRYVSNPTSFRPSTTVRSLRKADGNGDVPSRPRSRSRPSEKVQDVSRGFAPPVGVVFPIPLRSNLVVQIHGLPADLTEAEADRIAAVIKALAVKGH
jgi:hypothetical protein